MKKIKALTCFCETKTYRKESCGSPKIFFKVYFLFDEEYNVYREFIQIQKNDIYNVATYRHTDKGIISTGNSEKGYYNKRNVIDFRKKFLDLDYIDSYKYVYKKENLINLSDEKINEINEAFISNETFTKTTAKNMVSYLWGSNITGCKTNWKDNPLPIIENKDIEYNFANIFNTINEYRKKKKVINKISDIKINNINEIEEYSIKQFMELSPDFEETFFEVNHSFFKNRKMEKQKNGKTEEKWCSILKYHYSKIKEKIASGQIDLDKMQKKDIKQKLRNLFNKSCQLAENAWFYEDKYSVTNDKGSDPERSHIIGIATLTNRIQEAKNKKEKEKIFLFGIKHLNCLNLTKNLHSQYGKSQISIDPKDGRIYSTIEGKYLEGKRLNKKELIQKKEYLEENWEHFKKYKKNLG